MLSTVVVTSQHSQPRAGHIGTSGAVCKSDGEVCWFSGFVEAVSVSVRVCVYMYCVCTSVCVCVNLCVFIIHCLYFTSSLVGCHLSRNVNCSVVAYIGIPVPLLLI